MSTPARHRTCPSILRTVAAIGVLALLTAAVPAMAVNCAQYIGEEPPWDYSYVPKNSWVNKTWYVKNCGDTTWTTSWGVKKVSGNACGTLSFNFTSNTPPGSTATITASCLLGTASQYEAHFKVKTPSGTTFGDEFWFVLNTN